MDQKPARQGKKIGIGRKLSSTQEVEIFKLICTKRPWQLSLDKSPYVDVRIYLWDRNLVAELILKKCGIKLSDGGVVNHLKRWGFPLTSEGKRAYDGCARPIRIWLDENYGAIQERARAEDAEIFWLSNDALQNSEVGGRAKRQMLSAITNQDKIHWLVIKGQLTPERQIMLLRSLAGQSRKRKYLIRDDLMHYTQRDVVAWLRENVERVELFPPPEWKPESDKAMGGSDQEQEGGVCVE